MTNTSNQNCPLCNQISNSINLGNHGEDKEVSCPRCGDFIITEHALFQLDESTRYKLSAWTRDKFESGKDVPRISKENVDTIISSFPNYNVADKQRLLIRVLEANTLYPGKIFTLDLSTLWPCIWAVNEDEINYHIIALKERGLIKFEYNSPWESKDISFQITPKGCSDSRLNFSPP